MAQLRGAQVLFDGSEVDPGDVSTIYSKAGFVDAGPNVTIYIETDEDATFNLQVGILPTGVASAGRNAYDDSDPPDGGMVWFDYIRANQDATGFNLSSIEVSGSGAGLAVDLSPFAPQMLRLVRTDSGDPAVVNAFVTVFGAN